MTVEEAEKLLGPPTEKSDERIGWYTSPLNRHVASSPEVKITGKGLVGRRLVDG